MKFKTRISLNYLMVTAFLLAIVFVVIYFTVKASIYYHLDQNLNIEAQKHIQEVTFANHDLRFKNKAEWTEREHRESEVNPVFVQVMSKELQVKDRSPNLKNDTMRFDPTSGLNQSFDALLHGKPIRQMQVAISSQNQIQGYILTGISMRGQKHTLYNLQMILLVLYPIILIFLFFISRYLAGKSIQPVVAITRTTDIISKNTLNQRVPVPANQDELFDLSSSINHLLSRIENAMEREKQFTSHASHELRTPLAVLKGSLEVLIRKPRTETEYVGKIKSALVEINHMADITEQLLTMARLEQNQTQNISQPIHESLLNWIERNQASIMNKGIQIKTNLAASSLEINAGLTQILLGNILSNAIKFSPNHKSILIESYYNHDKFNVEISDEGNGISPDEINLIFTPFYRSQQPEKTTGSGLGLSIAQKAAEILQADIQIIPNQPKGTTFRIIFQKT